MSKIRIPAALTKKNPGILILIKQLNKYVTEVGAKNLIYEFHLTKGPSEPFLQALDDMGVKHYVSDYP